MASNRHSDTKSFYPFDRDETSYDHRSSITLRPAEVSQAELLAAICHDDIIQWPSPPRISLERTAEYEFKSMADNSEVRSLADFHACAIAAVRTCLQDLDGTDKARLIDFPVGTGKTHIVRGLLQEQGKSQLWLVENHDLINSHIAHFHRNSVPLVLKSRERMIKDKDLNCPFESSFTGPNPASSRSSNGICNFQCRKRKGCEYFKAIYQAAKEPVVYATHSHLVAHEMIQKLADSHDYIVIDEDYIGTESLIVITKYCQSSTWLTLD